MRTIKTFAWLPTKLTNGKWIWLKAFQKEQQWLPVWGIIEDLGWPHIPEYGWSFHWETTNKTMIDEQGVQECDASKAK